MARFAKLIARGLFRRARSTGQDTNAVSSACRRCSPGDRAAQHETGYHPGRNVTKQEDTPEMTAQTTGWTTGRTTGATTGRIRVRPIGYGIRIALAAGLVAALGACGGGERAKPDIAAAQVNTIGVNAFLWRASLDSLSFMPMLQTDSTGGVIVTDWYANPQNPAERMKVTVTILDQDLRADALRVAASREVMQGATWVPVPVQAATVQKLEDIILTRAREMRRDALMG